LLLYCYCGTTLLRCCASCCYSVAIVLSSCCYCGTTLRRPRVAAVLQQCCHCGAPSCWCCYSVPCRSEPAFWPVRRDEGVLFSNSFCQKKHPQMKASASAFTIRCCCGVIVFVSFYRSDALRLPRKVRREGSALSPLTPPSAHRSFGILFGRCHHRCHSPSPQRSCQSSPEASPGFGRRGRTRRG